MKIVFATIGDVRDIRRGSGTPYYLWQELQRQGHTVYLTGPLHTRPPYLTRLFKFISAKLGKKYFSHRDPFMAKDIGKETRQALKNVEYDILLTNDYSIAGYCKIEKPIVLFTDEYFPSDYSKNSHPWLANLSSLSVFFCQNTIKTGLQRAAKCIFASHSVLDEAQQYHLPNNKNYSVIPYGANIAPPDAAIVKNKKPLSQKKKLDLLFIGKDWYGKSGDTAVETTLLLNKRGINAQLHVVGVDLSKQITNPCITFYGLLNKDNESEKKQLTDLFSTCDILIVPSKAEGYGLAFVEAAAYGIPSLAYKTSGVTTAVQDGKSGVLFNLSEDKIAFVNQIETWIKQPEMYNKLSRESRQYYEQTANWESAIRELLHQVTKLV